MEPPREGRRLKDHLQERPQTSWEQKEAPPPGLEERVQGAAPQRRMQDDSLDIHDMRFPGGETV